MAFAPPNLIQVPPPGELRYGLFNVARGPLPLPDRAGVAGGLYDGDGCGTPRGYQADCDETPATKAFDDNIAEQPFLPFVVYASIVCGTAGYTGEYLEAKARRKLMAVEQNAVEQAVWSGAISGSGALGNRPTFQNGGTPSGGNPTVLTAAGSLRAGIAALEEFAGDNYGYVPVIHAEQRLAAQMGAQGLLRESSQGQPRRTFHGSLVSLGGGYTGTSNAGVAPAAGHAWLAVTGQVTVWRQEEIFVAPAEQTLNRTLNQHQIVAERAWAVTYDCFVAMVDVDLAG